MSEKQVALVLCFEKTNSDNYLVYYAYRLTKNFTTPHYTKVIASNGISLGVKNDQGTQVVNGSSGVASNISQYVFWVSRDS